METKRYQTGAAGVVRRIKYHVDKFRQLNAIKVTSN